MAAIACPVEKPGDDNLLSAGEQIVARYPIGPGNLVEPGDGTPSGTMSLVTERVRRFSTSRTDSRNGLSACAVTR